jgi:hypothetical protein
MVARGVCIVNLGRRGSDLILPLLPVPILHACVNEAGWPALTIINQKRHDGIEDEATNRKQENGKASFDNPQINKIVYSFCKY